MNWTGKVVGLLIGLLTRNRYLIVIGLIVGHLYDMGVFSAVARQPPKASEPVEDAYAVLGVANTASETEIEQAWRRKMSEYHPDRVANAAAEIRALAEQRAREINAAYETLQQQRRKG